MISLINSTNRAGNLSSFFTQFISETLYEMGAKHKILHLEEYFKNFLVNDIYGLGEGSNKELIKNYFENSNKLYFVVPEYNGSYPGVLKLFIDSIHPDNFKNKKAAILGVSGGRAGNIVGIDHLSSVLNYLGVTVMSPKQPISGITSLISNGKLQDGVTRKIVRQHVERFLNF